MGSATAVVLGTAGIAEAATTVALYHMESPSSLVDSSGYANNGKTSAITQVSGSSGKGYHFNGSSSVATVPSSSRLNPGTATLRLTAHVRLTRAPKGDYDLIRKGNAGTAGGEWKMEIFPPGSNPSSATAFCLFQDANTKTASIRDTKNLADGAWHTVVCVKTGSAVTVIVDGASHSVAAKLGSISNSRPLVIGSQSGGGDWYNGDMDEVSVQIG